jgi:integrase
MAINDSLRTLHRSATWRHCDARWNNLNLACGELRLSTRKTGRAIVLPLAASLRKQIECLLASSNEPSAPVHPKAFDLVERQRKTGNLSNQFAGLLAAAGLRQKKNHKSTGKGRGKRRNVEPLSSHSLRRTATTLLHKTGVPSAVAQALIGHDSEAMHELYIRSAARRCRRRRQLCPRSDGPETMLRLAFCFLYKADRHVSKRLSNTGLLVDYNAVQYTKHQRLTQYLRNL